MFHIHVGYENLTKYPNELLNVAIARAFDCFAVVPANYFNFDQRRDGNYGGFGKFRNKPYGIELRSLGGAFAGDRFLDWVYTQTIKTLDFVLNYDFVEEFLDLSQEQLKPGALKETFGIITTEQRVRSNIVLPEAQKLLNT